VNAELSHESEETAEVPGEFGAESVGVVEIIYVTSDQRGVSAEKLDSGIFLRERRDGQKQQRGCRDEPMSFEHGALLVLCENN
jgi:hypothetical protein